MDLGAPVGRVESEVVRYDLRNGQVTDPRPGTRLYAVRGYDPSFRLAAREDGGESDGGWAFYEVSENPSAKSAADLLDVGGKVERVRLEAASAEEVNPALGPAEAGGSWTPRSGRRCGAYPGSTSTAPSPITLEDGTRSICTCDPRSGELYLSGDPGGEEGSFTGVVLPRGVRASLRPAPRGRKRPMRERIHVADQAPARA